MMTNMKMTQATYKSKVDMAALWIVVMTAMADNGALWLMISNPGCNSSGQSI